MNSLEDKIHSSERLGKQLYLNIELSIRLSMEECDSSRFPPNSATTMIRKQNDSIKPLALIRAFVNENESFSFNINEVTG